MQAAGNQLIRSEVTGPAASGAAGVLRGRHTDVMHPRMHVYHRALVAGGLALGKLAPILLPESKPPHSGSAAVPSGACSCAAVSRLVDCIME